MHEVHAEVRHDCRVQPALTVGETVADASQSGEENIAEPARCVRQPEQHCGDNDRKRLTVTAVAEPLLQTLLQVAAEHGILGEADDQQIVDRPQPRKPSS